MWALDVQQEVRSMCLKLCENRDGWLVAWDFAVGAFCG